MVRNDPFPNRDLDSVYEYGPLSEIVRFLQHIHDPNEKMRKTFRSPIFLCFQFFEKGLMGQQKGFQLNDSFDRTTLGLGFWCEIPQNF